jgi:release factor glutamine methyltransferase
VLVDYAVKHMPEGARFADLCTGSGCIAVSTLKNTRGTRALAVDISEGALAVAARNAELNSVGDRLELARMDIMRSGEELIGRGIFAVLSNPPYIAEQVYRGLEPELFAEPRIALVGGADGGDFYRRLVPLALSVIDPRGFVALEIGYDQAELLRGLAAESGADIEIIKDLGGNDRVAVLRRGQ